MLSEKAVRRGVARIGTMKFISGDEDVRVMLAESLYQICSTDEQIDRLTLHFVKVYHEWPGVYELRACACSMFRPADGVEADSARYPEGIPTPRELKCPEIQAIPPAARRLDLPLPEQIEVARQIESGKKRRMIEGPITDDAELQALMSGIATSTTIPEPRKPRTAAEIEAELYKKHPVPEKKAKLSFEDQLAELEAKTKTEDGPK